MTVEVVVVLCRAISPKTRNSHRALFHLRTRQTLFYENLPFPLYFPSFTVFHKQQTTASNLLNWRNESGDTAIANENGWTANARKVNNLILFNDAFNFRKGNVVINDARCYRRLLVSCVTLIYWKAEGKDRRRRDRRNKRKAGNEGNGNDRTLDGTKRPGASKGYKHFRCVAPPRGKAPGYDSFPWFVKRPWETERPWIREERIKRRPALK